MQSVFRKGLTGASRPTAICGIAAQGKASPCKTTHPPRNRPPKVRENHAPYPSDFTLAQILPPEAPASSQAAPPPPHQPNARRAAPKLSQGARCPLRQPHLQGNLWRNVKNV